MISHVSRPVSILPAGHSAEEERKRKVLRRGKTVSLVLFLIAAAAACFLAPAEAARTLSREEFVRGLIEARGFSGLPGGASFVETALDADLIPPLDGAEKAPITRREALLCAVHSLGLSFESGLLVSAPLSCKDAKALSPVERGVLASATNMEPALWKKGTASFAPGMKITPEEANAILSGVKNASRSLRLSVKLPVSKGMTLRVNREGAYSAIPKWRAVVNGFESREEADVFRIALMEKGIECTVDSQNYDWRVRSPLLEKYGPVRAFLSAARSLGREGVVFYAASSWDAAEGPRYWAMLVMDPALYEIRPVISPEGIGSLAPLTSMMPEGAVAAVNGGYFSTAGKGKGYPIGMLKEGGVLITPPFEGRTCLGWNGKNQAAFGEVTWKGIVRLPEGGFMDITAMNRPVKGEGLAVYTRHFGDATPSSVTDAMEIVLDGDLCREVRFGGGNSILPGERVLAVYGSAVRFAASIKEGDVLKVEQSLNEGDAYWNSMTNVVQAGPFLLRKGQVSLENEKFSDSIVTRRHPRSVVGLTGNGQWFFFVGDGRNAVHSLGFTLTETAEILRGAGAAYALNLDGGGSTGLFAGGRFCNSLSDGRERPVSYGLAVFGKGGRQ